MLILHFIVDNPNQIFFSISQTKGTVEDAKVKLVMPKSKMPTVLFFKTILLITWAICVKNSSKFFSRVEVNVINVANVRDVYKSTVI